MRALTLILFATLALADGAAGQRQVSQTLPTTPTGAIRIFNLVGTVRVSGWDRDSIAVTGTIAGRAPGRFFMGGAPGAIKLGIESPFDETNAPQAELQVRVPRRSQLWIKTASASIEVSEFAGDLDLSSVSGGMRVAGTPEQVNAETVGGNLELVVATRSVRAKSGSGSITLRGSVDDLTASTVNGDIHVATARLQRGRIESVSGTIRFEGEPGRGAALSFQNHSGATELRLPAGLPADFTLGTFLGELQNEMRTVRPANLRDGKNREMTFSTGAGGADISARSFSGRITVRER